MVRHNLGEGGGGGGGALTQHDRKVSFFYNKKMIYLTVELFSPIVNIAIII